MTRPHLAADTGEAARSEPSAPSPSTPDPIAPPTAFKRTYCAACGAVFTRKPRGHGGRFCSARCRSRWHQQRRAVLVDDELAAATALFEDLGAAFVRIRAIVRELKGEARRD